VGEWKQKGIVTETNSPYASPVLLIKKKSGESRLVVDYRRLNAQTERVHYPLPNIDEYMEVLNGNKIFAVLDLAHGYLQVPLKKDARSKTAFITPDGTGEFTRAVFGLMNAPFYFSKVMEFALGPLRNNILIFYLDYILVVARDWEELMSRFEIVLQALEEAGLTLKLRKCQFGKPEIEYVGFIVGAEGVKPGPDKVRAIKEFPVPKDVREVKRFLGLTGFFRRFVPNYAKVTAAVSKLRKEKEPFHWGKEQQVAFEAVIDILTSEPTLQMFSPKADQTELHTDASTDGLGAILLQSDDKNRMRLVYAISRRTTEQEAKYHSSKLELLAVVWAVERLRVFLLSIPFTIVTDCQALIYLNSMRTKNPQVARWACSLSEYDYEIKHRKGEKMGHVDALSRAPVEGETLPVSQIQMCTSSEDTIMLHQRTDIRLKDLISILEKPELHRSKAERGQVTGYKLKQGLLYRSEVQNGRAVDLYVVPGSMRKSLAVEFHDLASHMGLDKTLQRMRKYYFFLG